MKVSEIEYTVTDQKEILLTGDNGLMLNNLPDLQSHVLIISGIRRCGKSMYI
jgi:hypothetical protein